jgi:lysophospholipase L1-like esterase
MKSALLRIRNLICAALGGLGLMTTGCAKRNYSWSTEAEYYKLPIWKQHVKTYKKLKHEPNTATIFIGDSMTEGFDLNRHLKTENLVNMGISGDFTRGVIDRLDYATRLQPQKVFVMIGINDILKAVPQDRIKSQYATIIETLIRDCPSTAIYIQSNLPTTMMGGSEINNAAILEKVNDLNQFLIEECQKHQITFIDMRSQFTMPDGTLKSELTYDGLHLSDDGYKVWTGFVLPMISH